VERHAGDIDALVTDVVMADMNGRELAEELRARQPDLKVLFMSGYSDDAVIRRGVASTPEGFLQKPFDLNAIARKVGTMLGGAVPGRGVGGAA
jgi:DNA-binding NarL/FixJ family response regulator